MPRLDDLIGTDELDLDAWIRLHHLHDALVAVGPAPELPLRLQAPPALPRARERRPSRRRLVSPGGPASRTIPSA